MKCVSCSKQFRARNRTYKYCSVACRQKHYEWLRLRKNPAPKKRRCGYCGYWFQPLQHNSYHCDRDCMNKAAVIKRRKKVKEMAVAYRGGKCCKCGYKRYIGALEFHHRNSRRKEITISADGCCHAWSRVRRELDKCDLLCANCHRERHRDERLGNPRTNRRCR